MPETVKERREAVLTAAAQLAVDMPLKESGFWFHADLRDNFYFAIHLFAHTVDAKKGSFTEEQQTAFELAVRMIGQVVELQQQQAELPMYGHWPLNLGSDPAAAKPNGLPAEMMGCIMTLFYEKYGHTLPLELKSDMSIALVHLYQSRFFMKPLSEMHHHEAKHTALRMLLGHQFDDADMLRDGVECARRLLAHVKRYGFREYGSLPWHWHWIQAFLCVREVVTDSGAKQVAEELLDYLWSLRANYYLRGAWAGAHSRQWPHDAPRDTNTLLDYIQFGDFPMPDTMPRLEGAGLYDYEVPAAVRRKALDRSGAAEVKRLVRIAGADTPEQQIEDVHTYAYITPQYAVGGVWERRTEFDNEQQRWDVTLPLGGAAAADADAPGSDTNSGHNVNQAYFFHPGAKYTEGDGRHASPYGEVLLHRNAAAMLYALPEEAYPAIVGILPRGEWILEEQSGYGRVGDVYIVYRTMQPCTVAQQDDRLTVRSEARTNAVVMEAIGVEESCSRGVESLEQLQQLHARGGSPFVASRSGQEASLGLVYTTALGDELAMSLKARHEEDGTVNVLSVDRSVNGRPVSFEDYRI
jgi:hypothetical protein